MIIIVVAVVALLAAGLGSAYLILRPDHPSGKLETQPGGISVSTAKPPPPPPIPKPKPKPKPTGPVYAVDKPCWLNFGGDPQRSLARLNINLGVPTKPLWARGTGRLHRVSAELLRRDALREHVQGPHLRDRRAHRAT